MTQAKTALIVGVTGQDGAYLGRLLLERGYRVVGTSRDAQLASLARLERLGVRDQIELASLSPIDLSNVLQVVQRVCPDEIYNLSGQSSVGLSFEQPVETTKSVVLGTLNLLEALRFTDRRVRFYNACSSECFGDCDRPASETTSFKPHSPYAVAKAAAHWMVSNYREAYGLHACSGILFNHESPLRPERFVTQKVVLGARRIAAGSAERLALGDLDIRRDWGWAPEYVEAMWLILQRETAGDFVIATGESHTLRDFVAAVFTELGLDWQRHVTFDPTLRRPHELRCGVGDAERARIELGWTARSTMRDVARRMVHDQLDG